MIYKITDIKIPEVNLKEVHRYLHYNGLSSETDALIEESIKETVPKVTPRICYRIFKINMCDQGVLADDMMIPSLNLKTALNGYSHAVLFAVTIGFDIDRLMSLYSKISPLKELIIEAVGNERIESLCDAFQNVMGAKHGGTGPRFSPGYGDLSLEFQKEVVRILDCQKNVGIVIGDNLLMSPVKSVTAFFGINNV